MSVLLLTSVYLRASPTVCFERLRARNRSGEEDIPLVSYIVKFYYCSYAYFIWGL